MAKLSRAMTFSLVTVICAFPALASSQDNADPARLATILRRSAVYCQKLDRAALDFICMEEVKETSYNLSPATDVYLYDYQLIRKTGGNERTAQPRHGQRKERPIAVTSLVMRVSSSTRTSSSGRSAC